MVQVYSDIKGNGPPTNDTPGAIGQIYVDKETGIRYECIEAFTKKGYKFSKEVYTWKPRGLDLDFIATDAEVEEAIDDLRQEISSGGTIPSGGISIWAEFVD